MQPPAQELVAKDLHDNTWPFRHIYRGIVALTYLLFIAIFLKYMSPLKSSALYCRFSGANHFGLTKKYVVLENLLGMWFLR